MWSKKRSGFKYPFLLLVLRWITPQSFQDNVLTFAMIGANIIAAVASESIVRNCSRNSGCSSICSYNLFQSLHINNKGIKSNPGAHLFPIWWDECLCGWSNTKSRSGAKKWQVHTPYYTVKSILLLTIFWNNFKYIFLNRIQTIFLL